MCQGEKVDARSVGSSAGLLQKSGFVFLQYRRTASGPDHHFGSRTGFLLTQGEHIRIDLGQDRADGLSLRLRRLLIQQRAEVGGWEEGMIMQSRDASDTHSRSLRGEEGQACSSAQ